MKRILLLVFISGLICYAMPSATAQSCASPGGSQTAFHAQPNYWLAYFYRNTNFTSYHGRVRYASNSNPNFDTDFEAFGATYDPWWLNNYNFDCGLNTADFSVRARMWRNVATATTYEFTVGAEGGVRLYIDNILVIDEWYEQTYNTYNITYRLSSGDHEFVLEYYDDANGSRASFNMATSSCPNTTYTPTYGSGNWWNAYFFDGKNFETYRRTVTTYGSPSNPFFDTNFGGDDVTLTGGGCSLRTETFSVRFMTTVNFAAGTYLFTVGGDDGFRLSVDGGATWLINNWVDQAYTIASQAINFPASGNRNLVLEFYENHGANRISFTYGGVLPVSIIKFDGKQNNGESTLSWQTTPESTEDYFVVERSTNGRHFDAVGEVKASAAVAAPSGNRQYSFTDRNAPVGSSWYRLKIIDQNGPEKYSAIVNINTNAKTAAKIYPTIIDQSKQLFIQSDRNTSNMEVVVRTISGATVFTKKLGSIARGQIATLPLTQASLSRGTYLVQVYSGGEQIIQRQTVFVQ